MNRKWLLIGAMVAVAVPRQAAARNTALYFSFDPGIQWYDTTELIVDKGEDTPRDEWVPQAGFQPELRMGLNVGGYGGAEAFIGGHWWGSGSQIGGGGVVGGLLRLTPLEVFQYLWKPIDKRFIDFGLSFGAGYTLVGEDFAYQGWFLQYGFDINFFILPFLSIGFELPIRQMLYTPFRYTHLGERRGLCTQGGTAYSNDGREVTRTAPRELLRPDGANIGEVETRNPDDPDSPITGNFILVESSDRQASACTGPAPEAWHYTPMLKLTFLIDFGI